MWQSREPRTSTRTHMFKRFSRLGGPDPASAERNLSIVTASALVLVNINMRVGRSFPALNRPPPCLPDSLGLYAPRPLPSSGLHPPRCVARDRLYCTQPHFALQTLGETSRRLSRLSKLLSNNSWVLSSLKYFAKLKHMYRKPSMSTKRPKRPPSSKSSAACVVLVLWSGCVCPPSQRGLCTVHP